MFFQLRRNVAWRERVSGGNRCNFNDLRSTGRRRRFALAEIWPLLARLRPGGRGRPACGTANAYGLDCALAERAVASPRRYGLHATLKAPMRLREGRTAEELVGALKAFASRRRPASAPVRLQVTRFARYLALTPQAPLADLDWLAQECETAFDTFRAPLDEADTARRVRPSMSAVQRDFVETFGYPFVLSEFRFHITLAGPLGEEELARVQQALAPAVAPFCAAPLDVREIVLLGDPGGDAPFRTIARLPLGG